MRAFKIVKTGEIFIEFLLVGAGFSLRIIGLRYRHLGLTTIFVVFVSIFCPVLAVAEDNTKKLDRVLTEITEVETKLKKNKNKKSSIKQELAKLKKKISTIEAKLAKTNKLFSSQKQVLAKLNRERARKQLKLQDAHDRLLSQINLAYQLEGKNNLKSIFNGYHKGSPDLLLNYHQYIFVERFRQMSSLNQILEQLEKNQKEIDQETKRLKRLESWQIKNKQVLEKTKAKQRKILSGLDNKIALQSKKLKKLVAAKKNVEKLVAKIAPHKLAKMSTEERKGFCKNFIWPTKGKITTHFGSSIEQSSWTWNGVVIDAPLGQSVYVALSGKVIYADRLSGYGLLLIIDHGNGYMSLYGHNGALHKGLNDRVAAGDLIAKIGKSDAESAQLYFGIRYNGEPIDPEKWCR